MYRRVRQERRPVGWRPVNAPGSKRDGGGQYGPPVGLSCLPAAVLLVAASGVAAADHHDLDSPPTYDSAEGASAGEESGRAPWLDGLVVRADRTDSSQRDGTQNTKTFGIDRGDDNTGSSADESRLDRRPRASVP